MVIRINPSVIVYYQNKRYNRVVEIVYDVYFKGGVISMLNNIPHPVLWLVIAVVLGIIEALTLSLMTIWFAIGALFAIIAAMFGIPFFYQVVVFIVTSSVLLYFTKPIIKKFLKVKNVKTNADKVVGEKGVVIEKIDSGNGTGQVKVGGQVWSAKSIDGQAIAVDEMIEVQEISGVKLIVKRSLK